jgi:mannitol-1-phosphate/altronate dehydrogenase
MRLATDANLAEEYFLRLKLTKTSNDVINNNSNSAVVVFNLRSQQTDGQLQEQPNTQTKITKKNTQDTSEADTTDKCNG